MATAHQVKTVLIRNVIMLKGFIVSLENNNQQLQQPFMAIIQDKV